MAIANPTMTDIGTFECVSGMLRASDPCYGRETWCAGVVANCRTGKWRASIQRQNCGAWGNRIARLIVSHEDGGEGRDDDAGFTVGVDSGQAGVFDDMYYDDDRDGDAYDAWCAITLGKVGAGTWKYGAASSSGYGDGAYEATIRRDSGGKCFYICIEFIGDHE